jgi:hypothetical protein
MAYTTNRGGFHMYVDGRLGQRYRRGSGSWSRTVTVREHFFVRERVLDYRFHTHFHAYASELSRRLVRQSVPGLQASDTEYETDVTLRDAGQVRAAGVVENLAAGTPLRLVDGTTASAAGETLRFAGPLVTNAADGEHVRLAANSEVLVRARTIVLSATGRTLELAADSVVRVTNGKPRPRLYASIFGPTAYTPSALVDTPYPVNELDFSPSGAYSVYNWELFYHVPLAVGLHLSKNQRYAEAQRWLQYIFDPTDDSDGPAPERFWRVKPFQTNEVRLIEQVLVNLSTGADADLWRETVNCINAWKDSPFRPHVVARYRHTAYMFRAVFAYLDNLIAWGDSLFRQDTVESINEATDLYVQAANLLGPRPQPVPRKGTLRPQTYDNLRSDLDKFGNARRQLEVAIPFDMAPLPAAAAADDRFAPLRSLGSSLYFCIPKNDKLLGYWTTVADRLYKIHNSLNIQGVFRQLPLFEPPIDPAMLARAAAAGLDVAAIVAGLNQPLPLVRFQFLVQRASEICQEVKSLGNNLLSAIEKEDNEALSILRARHERDILGLAEMVKYSQWQEARKSLEGTQTTLANAVHRYTYYERLLGTAESDVAVPNAEAIDVTVLEKLRLDVKEPEIQSRSVTVDIAQDLSGEGGGRLLNKEEVAELSKLRAARDKQDDAALKEQIGSVLSYIPDIGGDFHFWGLGGHLAFGGTALSRAMSMLAGLSRTSADKATYEAGKSAKVGSYARREQEWTLQRNQAAGEINQLYKQLRSAELREAIAHREWDNHKRQKQNAEEIENFLTQEKYDGKAGKKANKEFYAWMKREVRGLYAQCFQFAFELAKKAERALQHELGDSSAAYVQVGYLAGKEGLLAGEKLYYDVKRMEMAYHDNNPREREITLAVSLQQLTPRALIELRALGRCEFDVPEEMFDLGCPGHYFRRIKTVAISIPCVAGPYASVNCSLRLLSSTIRTSPLLAGDEYARAGVDDPRFSDYAGAVQSIVTSSAQNDSGMFETNLRDDRYLPFEGSGAISRWQLRIPQAPRQFDYDTIADVLLHVRYTAREGGELLERGARQSLLTAIDEARTVGSERLLSVRHEFSSAWARFKDADMAVADAQAELRLQLRPEHYPIWSESIQDKEIRNIRLYARVARDNATPRIEVFDAADNNDSLERDPTLGGLLAGELANINPVLPNGEGDLALYFDNNAIEDLLLLVVWGSAE